MKVIKNLAFTSAVDDFATGAKNRADSVVRLGYVRRGMRRRSKDIANTRDRAKELASLLMSQIPRLKPTPARRLSMHWLEIATLEAERFTDENTELATCLVDEVLWSSVKRFIESANALSRLSKSPDPSYASGPVAELLAQFKNHVDNLDLKINSEQLAVTLERNRFQISFIKLAPGRRRMEWETLLARRLACLWKVIVPDKELKNDAGKFAEAFICLSMQTQSSNMSERRLKKIFKDAIPAQALN